MTASAALDVLGLRPGTDTRPPTLADVRRAFRAAARATHPDHVPTLPDGHGGTYPNDGTAFHAAREAFEMLSSEAGLRAALDAARVGPSPVFDPWRVRGWREADAMAVDTRRPPDGQAFPPVDRAAFPPVVLSSLRHARAGSGDGHRQRPNREPVEMRGDGVPVPPSGWTPGTAAPPRATPLFRVPRRSGHDAPPFAVWMMNDAGEIRPFFGPDPADIGHAAGRTVPCV